MKMLVWKCVKVNKKNCVTHGSTHAYDFKKNTEHRLLSTLDNPIKLCKYGFHFTTSIKSLCSLWFDKEKCSRIALCEVNLTVNFKFNNDKACSDNIKILKVLSYKRSSELYDKANAGKVTESELQKIALED